MVDGETADGEPGRGTPLGAGRRRSGLVVLVVAGLLLAAGGCGRIGHSSSPPGGPGTRTDGSLVTPDGRTRTFHVYVPSTVSADQPVPLLVGLHGGTGWGTQFEESSGYDAVAEANRFIVVYPDGVGTGRRGDEARTWNAGVCCGRAQEDGVDDVAFIAAVIDQVRSEHRVDHVYATGHSNGALMSYRLACELSDRVEAIAIYAGTLGVDDCHPARPVAVMHVHGTGDENIPIEGGVGPRSVSRVSFPPPRDGAETLARLDGCAADPAVTTDGDLTTTDWSSCDASTEVRFVTIAGASHAWPGGGGAKSPLVGAPYAGYDASNELWAFLAAHPRPS